VRSLRGDNGDGRRTEPRSMATPEADARRDRERVRQSLVRTGLSLEEAELKTNAPAAKVDDETGE
jgi:hypothetical protein